MAHNFLRSDRDQPFLLPPDLALEACQQAREPKLALLPGGQFDAYLKRFDAASGVATTVPGALASSR